MGDGDPTTEAGLDGNSRNPEKATRRPLRRRPSAVEARKLIESTAPMVRLEL